MRDDRSRRTAWLAAALVVAAAVVVAARADLWQPYEPDLVETAREMRARGDWMHPRLNGLPYLEKPPLFYWCALAASSLAGRMSEFAARSPSLVAALVALVAIARFARDLFGRPTGVLAAAILATTPVFFASAYRGMTDGLLCAALVVAALCFRRDVWGDGRTGNGLAAWIALGLAFLAKGPVAVVATALLFLPEMILTRRLGPWLRDWRRRLPGAACFVAVVAPWYVAGTIESGAAFLHDAVWRQNGGRFFFEGDGDGPFFLVQMLPGQMGLWTLLVPATLWLAWTDVRRRPRTEFSSTRFLVVGTALVFAFLSASSGKLPKYLLIVMPYLAVLAAEAVARVRGASARAGFGTAVALLVGAGLLVVAGVAAPLAPSLFPRMLHKVPGLDAAWLVPVGIAFVAAGAAAFVFWRRRETTECAAALALGTAAAVFVVSVTPTLARIDESMTTRPFAERAAKLVDGRTPLVGYGVSDCESLFLFYAKREYELVGVPTKRDKKWRPEAVADRARRDGRVIVLTNRSHVDELAREGAMRLRVLDRQEDQRRDYVLAEATASP